MTTADLLGLLREQPLVASVQAEDGSPADGPETLLRLAQASLQEGVGVLRLQGEANISRIREATGAPTIGLIKKHYGGSEVYITPTSAEVESLIALGCEVIALDGTCRNRPQMESLSALIAQIHAAGRLAMADCDSLDSATFSLAQGADIIGTTLAGYTSSMGSSLGPDIELVRQVVGQVGPQGPPIFAEGRYSEPWQARMALRAGAAAVVVGGALNDPLKQTQKFARATHQPEGAVGAVDIGGTWLRAGVISPNGVVLSHERVPVPLTHVERNAWINQWIHRNEITKVGIGAGGIIDPASGEVLYSKPIIKDHVGTVYGKEIEAEKVVALNDGHATAWGHALHPQMAGLRVATLAVGTGVGFGIVERGRILMGRNGEHARINDTPTSTGRIFDDLLGGASVTANPSAQAKADAVEAAVEAVKLVKTLYYPDVIVLAGGIALQPWMELDRLTEAGSPYAQVRLTPYGLDAGLIGAGFLALYPFA